MDKTTLCASFGAPAGIFRSLNTTVTSIHAIILSPPSIVWETSVKPRCSHCSKARRSGPLAKPSLISCPVIAENVQSWLCVMGDARRTESCRPRTVKQVSTISVPVISAFSGTAGRTWPAWRLSEGRHSPRTIDEDGTG